MRKIYILNAECVNLLRFINFFDFKKQEYIKFLVKFLYSFMQKIERG